jgi:hypothetical protein
VIEASAVSCSFLALFMHGRLATKAAGIVCFKCGGMAASGSRSAFPKDLSLLISGPAHALCDH